MSDIDGYNADILAEQTQRLRELFPEVFAEDKIDFSKLKMILGEEVDQDERYSLNWKGKSKVFQKIQEKTTKTLKPVPEESVDWNTTQNLFVEGDNLEVLKTLHKAYYGKIKMIYIDPPYNTGNDFVYNDDFKQTKADYEEETGVRDEDGNKLRSDNMSKNTKDNGHFHSDWLNMIYPRLYLAKNLLKQDGVIFISIDDNEVHNLRLVMNEIFGEENFIAQFIWKRRQNSDSRNQTKTSTDHEYIIAYSRTPECSAFRGVDIDTEKYKNPDNDPRGPWASIDLSGLATRDQRPNLHYDIVDPATGNTFPPNPRRGWSKSKAVTEIMIREGRILFPRTSSGRPREKKFLKDLNSDVTGFSSWLNPQSVGYTTNGTREVSSIFGEKAFDFPKPVDLLKTLFQQTTVSGDIVFDCFSGSGTTAHAVNELNAEDGGSRQWICVQLPELTDVNSEAFKAGYKSVADISKERIRRASQKVAEDYKDQIARRSVSLDLGFKVYKLSDSNFKNWNSVVQDQDELQQQLLESINTVVADTDDQGILAELMLKNGISPLEVIEKQGEYYVVPSLKYVFYISRNISSVITNDIFGTKPNKVIFLGAGFFNDIEKANIILQAEQSGVDIEVI